MPEPHSILLVCTANQCRSPMAEALLKMHLEKQAPEVEWLVSSAGTWTQAGYPATPSGIQVMAEKGLDTSAHRSQPISNELLDKFQLILTMEEGHKEAMRYEFPEHANRIFMLSEMADMRRSIDDPIGKPLAAYRETADEIEDWIIKGLHKIIRLSK